MSMQNLSLTGTVEQSITPTANTTATTTGTGISTKGFRSMLAILNIGVVSGTNPTLDVHLEECDTVGGTYTAITGAVFDQQILAPSPVTDVTFVEVDLLPRKAFILAEGVIGGTSTPTFNYGVSFIFYNAVDSAFSGSADATVVS